MFSPADLILVDQAETPMHDVRRFMTRNYSKLHVETIQEWELINNRKFGLLASVDPGYRISTRYGSPTPDDLDELLSLVWKSPSFFIAHPCALTLEGCDGTWMHFEWERIVSFDHCCMDYVVEQCGEGLELAQKTYAGLVVDALASDDAHTGTDNYTFLYEYLVNERRASVVAEKLHMHRNNVKYRIDRIEELFGIDTDDPALRLDLLMAYLLREASLVQDAQ